MSLPKATVATTSIIGKILAASRPRWRLSPALWDTKPTIAGPIEPPISPAIAKKANIAVPPSGILAEERLIVPGHIIPTEKPQKIHPSKPIKGWRENAATK